MESEQMAPYHFPPEVCDRITTYLGGPSYWHHRKMLSAAGYLVDYATSDYCRQMDTVLKWRWWWDVHAARRVRIHPYKTLALPRLPTRFTHSTIDAAVAAMDGVRCMVVHDAGGWRGCTYVRVLNLPFLHYRHQQLRKRVHW